MGSLHQTSATRFFVVSEYQFLLTTPFPGGTQNKTKTGVTASDSSSITLAGVQATPTSKLAPNAGGWLHA
jgi:hypothetical protein